MKDAWSYIMGFTSAIFVFLLLVGWVMNIVELAAMEGFSGMLVLRVAGIFIAPLGAILGYL